VNEKTAKLIRKYAKATEANLNDLKRQWYAMDQFERRAFRVRMRSAVDAAASAPVAETTEEEA
jgi:hypothetical protein